MPPFLAKKGEWDMEKEQLAKAYLQRDPLRMMDMLGPLERGIMEVTACREDGVLLYSPTAQLYLLGADSLEAGKSLCQGVEKMDLVATHDKETALFLCEKYGISGCHQCTQAVYTKKDPLPVPEGMDIRQLGEEFFQVVADNYETVSDPKYIHGRLAEGVMHGAFEGETLMGFIGMHDEGSMGLLKVLPSYRRRGVASALMAYMTNWFLQRGWTPFSQIFQGNTPSEELHKKLGWTLCPQDMFWVMDE